MRLKRLVTGVLDLPEEESGASCRVTLSGKSALMLEGRHRAISCNGDSARFITPFGILRVTGSDLTLAHLGRGESFVKGTIDQIGYE